MPWIENIAAADVTKRYHHEAGENSMLIQIMDTATSWWPVPRHEFKETYKFEFLDIEKDDEVYDEECRVSRTQAEQLVQLLQHAKENQMNVIVHCYAGICRSGAVCEVGVMLGFKDTGRYRQPNLLVKHLMMQALGWTYDEDEVSKPINGSPWGDL